MTFVQMKDKAFVNHLMANGQSDSRTVPNLTQARWWIATIPESDWQPCIPNSFTYAKGQLEQGESGYRHWQAVFHSSTKKSLRAAKQCFPATAHLEPTRSAAATKYVWKEDTRVPDSQFELGDAPFHRSQSTDWAVVRSSALAGDWTTIPDDVYIRHYGNLQRIHYDNISPSATIRTCKVFYGATGTGKTRRAFEELPNAYWKTPTTKFWCGYRGQEHVIVDEFRGVIDIAHLLRWVDRYPVIVETKGSARPLMATTFIFTSNLHPKDWYPTVDSTTLEALLRRLEVINL